MSILSEIFEFTPLSGDSNVVRERQIIEVDGSNDYEDYLLLIAAANQKHPQEQVILYNAGHAKKLLEFGLISQNDVYYLKKDGIINPEQEFAIASVNALLEKARDDTLLTGDDSLLKGVLIDVTRNQLRSLQPQAEVSLLNKKISRISQHPTPEAMSKLNRESEALQSGIIKLTDIQVAAARTLANGLNSVALPTSIQATVTLMQEASKVWPIGFPNTSMSVS